MKRRLKALLAKRGMWRHVIAVFGTAAALVYGEIAWSKSPSALVFKVLLLIGVTASPEAVGYLQSRVTAASQRKSLELMVAEDLLMLCRRLPEIPQLKANLMVKTDDNCLALVAEESTDPDYEPDVDKTIRAHVGDGCCGASVMNGTTTFCDLRDTGSAYHFKDEEMRRRARGVLGIVSVPVRVRDTIVGVLNVDTGDNESVETLLRQENVEKVEKAAWVLQNDVQSADIHLRELLRRS